MPVKNSLTGLLMADIESGGNNPTALPPPPVGYLNSREVFSHVLAKRWGQSADYDRTQRSVLKEQPKNIDVQWVDATDLIHVAIGDGQLTPFARWGSELRRITRDQWPRTNPAWWQETLFLATPMWPVPESLEGFEVGSLCFEMTQIENWLAPLKPHEKAAKGARPTEVQSRGKLEASMAAIKSAYEERYQEAERQEIINSREDDRRWICEKFGPSKMGLTRIVDDLRRSTLSEDRQKGGRPPKQ